MAITVTERMDSQGSTEGAVPSVMLHYSVTGSAVRNDVVLAVAAAAPALVGTLGGRDFDVRPSFVDVNNPAACIWDATVRYSARPATGSSRFGFDTTGATQHISHSLATVGRYALPGLTAPDNEGAINATATGVAGITKTVPGYRWPETHYLADAYIDMAYRLRVSELTGRVNQYGFRGWDPGEVMFLGAQGGPRDEGDWELTFQFAGEKNKTGLTVGDIKDIEKKGWEYLWVRSDTELDEASGMMTQLPIGVYVEQIALLDDFGDLGIGT